METSRIEVGSTGSGVPNPRLLTPSPFRVWLQAIRIFSFTASVIPILVGSAFAIYEREFDPLLFVLMVLASVACHAGANLANDYFDHVKGIDNAESLGPSKVIQQQLLTPAEVQRGMFVAFGIATILGLVIVFQSSWVILALALASLAAAYFYTGGPKPLGYVALGEVTVFIFMGPVMVGGAYFVHTGHINWEAILASLPVGCLVAEILHANNIRDIGLDRAAGKVTLSTLLGRRAATVEYVILIVAAYFATVALVVSEPGLWPCLIVGITLPIAFQLSRTVASYDDPPTLNRALRKTAGLHLRFGTLLTGGLLVAAILDRVF